jgi:hypothetical protein
MTKTLIDHFANARKAFSGDVPSEPASKKSKEPEPEIIQYDEDLEALEKFNNLEGIARYIFGDLQYATQLDMLLHPKEQSKLSKEHILKGIIKYAKIEYSVALFVFQQMEEFNILKPTSNPYVYTLQ